MEGLGFSVLFCQELGFHYARSNFQNNLTSGKQPVLVWDSHYGFRYALGRMVKKGAPVKIGVCVPIVAEPVTGQSYGTFLKACLRQTVQE